MLHAPDTSVSSVLKRGFSLIELSIVVAILSIVSVLGLEVATSFIGARAYDRTKEQLKVIDQAIVDFYWVTGRLPCPADRSLSIFSANHGIEDCTLSPISGITMGAVPTRTLNLQPGIAIDAYGNRINYFVTTRLTPDYHNFNVNLGAIEIRAGQLSTDCSGGCSVLAKNAPPLTGAAYALISFGADRAGAITRDGAASVRCGGGGGSTVRIDAQNCNAINGNPIVLGIVPDNADTVLYDSRYNNGSVERNYFDDIVVWRKKGQL